MLRRVVNEQMNVVGFAVHLSQLRFKVTAHLGKDGAQPTDGVGVKYIFPILCHKDQVDVKLKHAVSAVSDST